MPSTSPAPAEGAVTLGRVAELRVYPVKSLGGVRVARATVGELGLASDRRWMLVDDDGVFYTQRALPRMALARAEPIDGGVRVTTAGRGPLELAPPAADAPRRRVRIWDDVVEAQTYPAEVDAWFAPLLERPCHLVYIPDDVRRPVDPTYAGPDDRAAFSDAFPVLLLSRESLADLNARLVGRGVTPAVVERFRPNVLVEGTSAPFAEDAWTDVWLGAAGLRVVKPCARCVLTTVDPATAEPSARGEPLRTLATYRTRGGKVLFAQNALVTRGGDVAEGDVLRGSPG
jgi:uncharacterized protein YcbX